MATFLDFTILQGFASILTWILVWIVAFGLLDWVAPFGKDKKGIYALISFILAFFVLFSSSVRYFVEYVVPWFTLMAIVIFFILFAFMAFGVKTDVFAGWGAGPGAKAAIITVSVIILLFALGGAIGQPNTASSGDLGDSGDASTGIDGRPVADNTFASKVVMTITNPQVLGLIFIMLVGTFTIVFMSRN